MERTTPIISLVYTGCVALITAFNQQDTEFFARLLMYFSATILSIITAYYMIKNKGKK